MVSVVICSFYLWFYLFWSAFFLATWTEGLYFLNQLFHWSFQFFILYFLFVLSSLWCYYKHALLYCFCHIVKSCLTCCDFIFSRKILNFLICFFNDSLFKNCLPFTVCTISNYKFYCLLFWLVKVWGVLFVACLFGVLRLFSDLIHVLAWAMLNVLIRKCVFCGCWSNVL